MTVRESEEGGCQEGGWGGEDGIVVFHSLPKAGAREEGEVCGELQEAKQALDARGCEGVDAARLRVGDGEGDMLIS